MRKVLILFILLGINISVFAKEFTPAQQKLRSEIFTFLKEEGYMPEIDSDGDVKFKKEGTTYYVRIYNNDEFPMYLALSIIFNYDEVFTKEKTINALPELNKYKGVKTVCYETYYLYQAEIYLTDSEYFKYVYNKLMSQLSSMRKEHQEICTGSKKGTGNYSFNENNSENLLAQLSKWECESHDNPKISLKNGTLTIKDTKDYGFADALYYLDRNLKNVDFQLDYQVKIDFAESHSTVFLIMGSSDILGHCFGMTEWDGDVLSVKAGTYAEFGKYLSYTKPSNATASGTNNFRIIKKGNNVSWSCNGREIYNGSIDSDIDITKIGFLMSNKHQIKVSRMNLTY